MSAAPRRLRRSPPSEHARGDLIRLLSNGVGRNENVVSEFVKAATRALVQQLLEAEQADFLGGRGRYGRRAAKQRGSRNGYEPIRLHTDEGVIKVNVPQVRNVGQPYRSSLMRRLDDETGLLDRIVLEAYGRALSPRSSGHAFEDVNGVSLVSPSAVHEVIRQFSADHLAFFDRDLSDVPIEHLFCDAAFESPKRKGRDEALLVAWSIDTVGRKLLLQLAVGDKASETAWKALLHNLIDRNLRTPRTVTTNGSTGMAEAVATVFPKTVRFRHWFDRPTERRTGIA
ncbi:MAG: transposase [Acidimicrobiales bacterium]